MSNIAGRLYLCGALENGGATLLSWCFWQRVDIAPVIVPAGNTLPAFRPAADGRATWAQVTIGSFRLSEMAHYYRQQGWDVHPLLVVSDLRPIWASQVNARAGEAGMGPPLQVRFRRFVDDWTLFLSKDWPTVRVDDLAADAERTLRNTADRLDLPWNDALQSWPRAVAELPKTRELDPDFDRFRRRNLAETLANYAQRAVPQAVAREDLQWLEREFQRFNIENSYPPILKTLQIWSDLVPTPAVSASLNTGRSPSRSASTPLRWILNRLGIVRPHAETSLKRAV
jgi:hypothetical protein